MSVSSDLNTRTGATRRLVLRIAGLNYDFWEPHEIAAPTGGSWRTPLSCLSVGDVGSLGLDISKMEVTPSGLTFTLSNIYDDSANRVAASAKHLDKYLLPKLFNVSRTDGAICYTMQPTTKPAYIKPTDTTVYCTDNTGFPSSGVAYIGNTPFSYTGISSVTVGGKVYYYFSGVVLGIYPPTTASYFARAIPYSRNTAAAHQDGHPITQYPQTVMGRDVILYATTLKDDGTWNALADAETIWYGRLSDEIAYDAATGAISLSCTSILSAFDEKIGPRGENIQMLGCHGGSDDDSILLDYSDGANGFKDEVVALSSATKGYGESPYDIMVALLVDISDAIAAKVTSYSVTPRYDVISNSDGEFEVYLSGGGSGAYLYARSRPTCHNNAILVAFGKSQLYLQGQERLRVTLPQTAHTATNTKLYLDTLHASALSKQGDAGDVAYVAVEDLDIYYELSEGDSSMIVAIDTTSGATTSYNATTGQTTYSFDVDSHPLGHFFDGGYARAKKGIKPVLFFDDPRRSNNPGKSNADGIFGFLLRVISSTGAQNTGYNGTYDVMRSDAALGVMSSMIDAQSFLDADKIVSNMPLNVRPNYYVATEPTKFSDILKAECALYGFAAVWSSGKLRLKHIVAPSSVDSVLTLSEDTNAQVDEMLNAARSVTSVVNVLEVEPYFERVSNDFADGKITIVDADSVDTTGTEKKVSIKHRGITAFASTGDKGSLTASIRELFGISGWAHAFRYGRESVDFTIGPEQALQVGIGSVVRLQSDTLPSWDADGTFGVDAYAVITNYELMLSGESAWTARVSAVIFALAAHPTVPWSPSALITAYSWSDPYLELTLEPLEYGVTGDREDGNVFQEDDRVVIVWTNPTSTDSDSVQGPYTVSTVYNDTTNKMELTDDDGVGWSPTADREYVVTFTDYDDIEAQQDSRGSWAANARLQLNGVEADAKRYR